MITFKYLVLELTCCGFGLGYLPGRRMNRAAVAIVGSDECGGFGDKLLRQREIVCYVRLGKDLTSGD
jgi:hypothetical protein